MAGEGDMRIGGIVDFDVAGPFNVKHPAILRHCQLQGVGHVIVQDHFLKIGIQG